MKNNNLSGGLFASGKPQPLTIKETPLSAQIKQYLDNRNIWNERLNSGKIETKRGNWITLCEKGTPDRICIVRGQTIFIEVKRRGEKPTSEQLDKHCELRASGAIVIIADSFTNFIYQFQSIRAEIEEAKSMQTIKEFLND